MSDQSQKMKIHYFEVDDLNQEMSGRMQELKAFKSLSKFRIPGFHWTFYINV